ncbi:MAG: hypothetical protein QMD07_03280 [Thermodesulfovibrionales bacterium]|nr:hypothetical protein [Thermodesulfovibrionales bacterium]
MKKIALINMLSIVLLCLVSVSFAHDLVWPGEKLKAMFPTAESFEQKNLYVSDEQRATVEKALGYRLPEEDLKPSIYLAIVRNTPDSKPRKAAAIMFIDAHGEGGKIEMGVVVNGKGELMRIHIFENNEPEKVKQQPFLGQFENKKGSSPFTVGKDIAAPKGNEKSAQAIASGARRGLLLINEMFKKK